MTYKPGDYERYHSSPRMKAENAKRKKVRRDAEKAGKVRPFDGKEIDHKDGNPNNNSKKNLRVISRHANRVKQ
jgi:hypothetical protein